MIVAPFVLQPKSDEPLQAVQMIPKAAMLLQKSRVNRLRFGLTFARRERGQGYQISETASGSADQAPRAVLCFFCNGALGFHAARGTYVANIHKTLHDPVRFFASIC
jgi:hypothetical protein